MISVSYLIVGGGAAALSAAEAIRKNDASGSIAVLSSDKDLPYSRPMLTKQRFSGSNSRPLPIRDEKWFRDNSVCFINAEVKSLDWSRHEAVAGNEVYSYGKCILAVGAENFVPPFNGIDKAVYTTIRRMDDIRFIRKKSVGASNAVVIGGGVIGLEAAYELCRSGLKVTVLEALEYLMPRLLDRSTAEELRKHITAFDIVTGAKVRSVNQTDGVVLEDGTKYPYDILVVSCGVRANIALARNASIECGRAIIVDEHMKTSAPDVFACGDCAELNGVNYALWSQAVEEGRVAGLNASGSDETVGRFDTSVILNAPAFSFFASGDLGQMNRGEYTSETVVPERPTGFTVNRRNQETVGKIVYLNGKPVGAAMIGGLEDMQKLRSMLEEAE